MELITPILRTPIPRPTARRARSRVVRSIVVAVILVGGGVGGMWWKLETDATYRDPVYAVKFRTLMKAMRETGNPQPVIAFGSSRLDNGFRAGDIERATNQFSFNFGVAGGGPLVISTYLNRLETAGIRPRAVIVEVVPAMLHGVDHRTTEANLFPPSRFLPAERARWREFGAASDAWTKTQLDWGEGRSALWVRTAPWLIERSRMNSYPTNCDPRGWNRHHFESRTDAERRDGFARARIEHRPGLADLAPGGGSARAFHELVERLRDRPLRFLLMPESVEFRQLYGPGANDQLLAFLRSFNVPLIDARDWVPDDQFTDGHHLLPVGAETFTTRLLRDELQSWLAGMP